MIYVIKTFYIKYVAAIIECNGSPVVMPLVISFLNFRYATENANATAKHGDESQRHAPKNDESKHECTRGP